jgi:signal transduction histidine kinase
VVRRGELLAGLVGAAVGVSFATAHDKRTSTVIASAVLGAALAAGRRHPRAAWMTAIAAILAMGDQPTDGLLVLVPAHAFCAGRWDTRTAGAIGGVALIAAQVPGLTMDNDPTFVPFILLPGAAWIAARALADRERVANQLAERARELEAEREAHAQLSLRYERARIASELHDIVAHAISVMVVQASAGQRLAAHDPELTAEAFGAIAGAARQAEEDMGRLVALLGDDTLTAPAPDLALVEELVRRAAGSGLAVKLRLEGDREGLPEPVVQTACRVVQEGLTNALRYAAGAAVTVLLRGEPSRLVVEVANGPAPREAVLEGTGTGHGLGGLRERVGACGGTVESGPRPDGGWRLRASLPRLSSVRVSPAGDVHPAG